MYALVIPHNLMQNKRHYILYLYVTSKYTNLFYIFNYIYISMNESASASTNESTEMEIHSNVESNKPVYDTVYGYGY